MTLLLYGIVESRHPGPDGAAGIHGQPLRLVCAGGLAAVVEAAPARPAVSLDALHAFAQATGRLAQAGPILPARFGTTVPNEAAAAEALKERAETLEGRLHRVRGAVEYGARVLLEGAGSARDAGGAGGAGDAGGAGAHASAIAGDVVGDVRSGTRPMGAGAAYLLGRLAEDRRAEELAERIRAALAPVTRSQLERPDRRHGIAIACLVDRTEPQPFLAAVEGLRRDLGRDGQLICTGPWAPFSFSAEAGA